MDIREEKPVSVKYYLSETYLNTLVAHKKRHESKGNGFGYEIISDDGIANAVVCGGMGRERNSLSYPFHLYYSREGYSGLFFSGCGL